MVRFWCDQIENQTETYQGMRNFWIGKKEVAAIKQFIIILIILLCLAYHRIRAKHFIICSCFLLNVYSLPVCGPLLNLVQWNDDWSPVYFGGYVVLEEFQGQERPFWSIVARGGANRQSEIKPVSKKEETRIRMIIFPPAPLYT